MSFLSVNKFLLILIRKEDHLRDRDGELLLQMPVMVRAGPGCRQEPGASFRCPHGQQEHGSVSLPLLPPRVYIHRKLESKAHPGLKPCTVVLSSRISAFAPNVCGSRCLKDTGAKTRGVKKVAPSHMWQVCGGVYVSLQSQTC